MLQEKYQLKKNLVMAYIHLFWVGVGLHFVKMVFLQNWKYVSWLPILLSSL